MTNISDKFERALGEILARVFFAPGGNPGAQSVAVAYSGGLDSTALLHLAHGYASEHGVRLFALHVHHGLSSNADAWLGHCERECARIDVPFDARRVSVERGNGRGVEAAARSARYAALAQMCRAHGVPLLLTAHHLDDQAETVLLQLFRGAGVAGLSGMDAFGTAPDLLGGNDLTLARPLLSISRANLEGYVKSVGVAWIEDESNTDPRYARNALRQRVAPVLETHFPGFAERVSRSAQHAQFAQRLLDEIAGADWKACSDGDGLNPDKMRKLSADRAANLLRHWLGMHGLRMPSTAWLHEAMMQLLEARGDAQVCVALEGCEIRRHRNRIVLITEQSKQPSTTERILTWDGAAAVPVPEFGGFLLFEPADEGIDAAWLRAQPLRLSCYRGEARIKLESKRPSRSLKSHCQELGIPAWERLRLPLLFTGNHLLFAPGIGTAWRYIGKGGGQRVRIGWTTTSDPLLL